MRRTPVALAITLVALAVVLAAVLLRPPADVAAPSPSPTAAPTATATATATATPAASPSLSPSPTPQGLYMSKKLNFALVLPPPWRLASCGNSEPTQTRLPLIENFTSASVADEEIGHIGSPNDRVELVLEENPQRLSAVDFAKARPLPGPQPAGASPPPIRSVTFAGRQAAEVGPADAPQGYFIPDGDRVYSVLYRPATARTPDTTTMSRIVRSFRFLSASERQALPDPTPIPAGAATPQALARLLKSGFESKDLAALERLLSPCVSIGAQNGGGGAITRERHIASLRDQFARGLSVTVDTSSVRTDDRAPGITFVRSRWTGPLGPQNYDFMLRETSGGYYWFGALLTR